MVNNGKNNESRPHCPCYFLQPICYSLANVLPQLKALTVYLWDKFVLEKATIDHAC